MFSSRRSSQLDLKSPKEKKSMNIIDFLLQQNFDQRLNTSTTEEPKFCQNCSPRIQEVKEEMKQYVTTDRFQTVIEKIWQKLKRIEEETIKNNQKSQQLEKYMVDQQQLLSEFDQDIQNKQPDIQRLEKKFDKKITANISEHVGSINENIAKHIQQQKEITNKYYVMQEKHQQLTDQLTQFQEQIQMINHRFSLTKEEMDDKLNSIVEVVKQNNEVLRSNTVSTQETEQNIHSLEADINRIFQNIQGLLKLDHQVQESDRTIQTMRGQLSQLRKAVNDIEVFKKTFDQKSTTNKVASLASKTQSNWVSLADPESNPKFFLDENCIIHSKQASMLLFHQTSDLKMRQAKQLQAHINKQKQKNQTKDNFGVTGMRQVSTPSSTKGNQTGWVSINKPPNQRLKHYMSEKSKRNFLHFLLVQKIGQKNEKSFNDFLRKTYNFEPPRVDDEVNVKVSKKGIRYLYQKDENQDVIEKEAKAVLNGYKTPRRKDPPLDKYLVDLHEKQLRRFPKLKGKLDSLSDLQIEQQTEPQAQPLVYLQSEKKLQKFTGKLDLQQDQK